MPIQFKNVEEYIASIDKRWLNLFHIIYQAISNNIPKDFLETISYGMIGFVVPLEKYPHGYHVNPKLPLPFVNIAVQKNWISIYHMGLYNNEKLLDWFITEHIREVGKKPTMGKSCIKYKNEKDFPNKTFKQLMKKISLEAYIKNYEKATKK